ncbi:MAG: LuxR C-terminal-related transcriptional regulator [Ilumatobacteraceae bacterium]
MRCGAARPGGELVSRLERNLGAEQIRLERLDRQEVSALVASITSEQPSSALVDAVLHRSEGVPFVVEELVRAVRPGKAGHEDAATAISSAELPWSLSDAVRQQLSGLTTDERRVVESLAVFDDIASFDELHVVADLDSEALTSALRDLVGDGVVAEVDDDRFWFSHALMAETVAGELLGRERRRLHGRSLDALEGVERADGGHSSPDYAAMVRHAAGAGRFDEIGGYARIGARSALDAGATFLALRIASQGLDEECDDPLLLGVATEAAWRLDFLDEAAEHATKWAAAATGGSLVDALRMESRISFERIELDAGEHSLARLISIADDEQQPLDVRAGAEASLSQLFMFTHRTDESVRWADRAIVHAREVGDDVIAARAAVERASSRSWIVPREVAETELRAAIDAARAAHDFIATAWPRQPADAAAAAHRRGRRVARRTAPARAPRRLRQAWRRGGDAGLRRSGGARRPRRCPARHAETWSSWMQVGTWTWAGSRQAFLAIEEGRFADAEAVLRSFSLPDDVIAARTAVNEDPFHIPIMWLELAALRGDRVLGERAFDALVAIDSGWNVFFNDVVIAVDSALALGIEPQRVREAFVTPMASAEEAVKIEDASSYVEGLLAVGDGRHRDAIAFLEPLVGGEADERVEAIPRATTRIALVRAYLAIGDRARALDLVRRVVEVDLGRWPGVRRDRAEEILRRLSPTRADGASRAANAADAGPGGSLTPREREVAMLLSEGLTNGQLAERLYISPKTAAVHVSNILAKLDLSGRAEIAAWAVRNMGEPASTV